MGQKGRDYEGFHGKEELLGLANGSRDIRGGRKLPHDVTSRKKRKCLCRKHWKVYGKNIEFPVIPRKVYVVESQKMAWL